MNRNIIFVGASVFFGAMNLVASFPANADSESVKCVQEQLLSLEYEVGTADGKLGRKSLAAAEAYMAKMRQLDPNWALAGLSDDTARDWCESVAVAWPEARPFWERLKAMPVAAEVTPSLNDSLKLNVVMDKGANFAVAFLAGDKTLWTSGDLGPAAGSWTANVPAPALQDAERYCIYLQQGWIVRDTAGKKYSGSCQAISDDARLSAEIFYQLKIEQGQPD